MVVTGKVEIKKLFIECINEGMAPEVAKAVIEAMIETANDYNLVEEMFKGYITR